MERMMTVTGKGKLSLSPDTVCIRMELSCEDPAYEEVIKASAERTAELKESFLKLGFPDDALKTLSFRVDTEYESYEDPKDHCWKQRFKCFRSHHSLKVEFDRKEELLGKVLSMLSRLKSRPEFYVEYRVKDQDKAKNELISRAVQDAREKALVIAEASGASLGEILSINYSFSELDMVSPPMFRMAEAKMAMNESVNDAGAGFAFDVTPDDIKVEDTITLVFKLL